MLDLVLPLAIGVVLAGFIATVSLLAPRIRHPLGRSRNGATSLRDPREAAPSSPIAERETTRALIASRGGDRPCPHCGRPSLSPAAYCRHCGYRLAAEGPDRADNDRARVS